MLLLLCSRFAKPFRIQNLYWDTVAKESFIWFHQSVLSWGLFYWNHHAFRNLVWIHQRVVVFILQKVCESLHFLPQAFKFLKNLFVRNFKVLLEGLLVHLQENSSAQPLFLNNLRDLFKIIKFHELRKLNSAPETGRVRESLL